MVKDILIKLGLTSGDFKKGLNEAGNAADDFSKKTDKASKSTSDLLDAGEEMPGVMGRAASGIKGLIGTVKTLATTLLANPIGIIITAIAVAAASLYAIFKDFAPLTDLIADKFARLQGAFSGLQTAVYSFTQGLGFNTKAIGEQADAAERASKMQRDYNDNLSAFNLKQAQYEAQIDKLLKQAKNKSLSDKQSNELIKEAKKLQDEQIKALQKNARTETAILVEKAKAAGATYDQIAKIQKGATIESLNNVKNGADDELIALQQNYQKRLEEESRLDEKRVKIENAEAARNEKIKAEEEKRAAEKLKLKEEEAKREEAESNDRDERAKEYDEKAQKQLENDRERQRSINESKREQREQDIADLKAIAEDETLTSEQKLAEIKSIEDRRTDIEQEAADARTTIAQKEKDAKAALLNAYSQILSTASDLAGKDTAMGKALAVASATISTYSAIAGQLAVHSKPGAPPIPGYAIAQAIATGVAGFAAVKNILSVKVPGGGGAGGGGGSMPSMNLPTTRPSSGFTMLGNEDPIRTTNEGGKIKVFVTESDITNSQNKVSSIQAKATIG